MDARGKEFVRGLRERTKTFALEAIRVAETLPATTTAQVLKKQLVRSATSVGANYHSACRARSRADFVSKIRIAIEEADETQYWLELLTSVNMVPAAKAVVLHSEADQLIAILTASAKTATQNRTQEQPRGTAPQH